MAANVQPIFSKVGDIQWGAADGNGGTAGPLKTANTAKDGTGTVLTVFTADATNGGWVEDIVVQPVGTNTASVLRVFINNGSTNATIANNTLIANASLPSTTLTEVAGMQVITIPIRRALPAGYKLNVTLGTTVAAGWQVTTFGGKY
jgi:hypothetical protein